ncbi:winged helix-turn-helix domain-containing protein [Halorussus ruber]|uniref:winged helix-turn-helix domain-containing protein n=1 Tax=Halorussus ruber TaxID=1126238 RepID=UPI00143DCADD|nr:helix-turn-helix domain-containing protein [Halorussus ruber]
MTNETMPPQSSPPVEKYSGRIPDEIKRAIDAINGDVQYAIVVLLIKEEGLAFTQLQEELDVHQNTLSRNLDRLMDGGLLDREEFGEHSEKYKAKYTITSFGKRFIDHLFESIDPTWQRQSVYSNRNMGRTNERFQQEPTDRNPSIGDNSETTKSKIKVNS